MKTAKRILVVDDEKTILLSLAYALKADGVEVITCNKAEWAEKAVRDLCPSGDWRKDYCVQQILEKG